MAEIYYEPTGCNCDGTSYSQTDINAAASLRIMVARRFPAPSADLETRYNADYNMCKEALSLASQGQTLGRDKYPHAYNDYEHFTFQHASQPYLEFPIMAGSVYDGSSPGADRVIIGSIAADYSSAVYCAVITHDGQRKNGFAECSDDSMNPRGKGDYQTQEKKGHHHRKLVEKIEL